MSKHFLQLKKYCIAVILILVAKSLPAVDIWRYPEMAGKNALFIGFMSPSISFTEGFQLPLPRFSLDYMLPIGVPVSMGVYLNTPAPNLKNFGLRCAYHIDLNDPKTDLYLLYVFDFGFLRNELLAHYNDEPQEIHYYDFRGGIRRVFNQYVGLFLESDFKFQGLMIGLFCKLW